jgi:hypothetical protein
MEKQNTVTIGLKEYNLLRDFKLSIENGKNDNILCYQPYGDYIYYPKENTLIGHLVEGNKRLEAQLKDKQYKDKDSLLSELKHTKNIFQVIYWKLFKNKN